MCHAGLTPCPNAPGRTAQTTRAVRTPIRNIGSSFVFLRLGRAAMNSDTTLVHAVDDQSTPIESVNQRVSLAVGMTFYLSQDSFLEKLGWLLAEIAAQPVELPDHERILGP